MPVVLIIAAIVILFAVTCYVYISKLPSEFKGTIKLKIYAPASRVWDYISDIEGTPLRKKEIKKIEVVKKDGGIIQQWREFTDMGGHILFEKVEVPHKKLEKKMIESSFGMTGTWVYEIEDNGNHCLVCISESSELTKPWVKFVMALAGRNANLKREMKIIEKFSTLKQ